MNAIKQNLDAYTKENIYDFDNEIILHYYPKRIIEKLGGVDPVGEKSLLELGLGHGYSALEFQKYFSRYRIIEGDKTVIDKFINGHGSFAIDIVHSLFEEYESDEQFDVVVAGFVLEHVSDPVFVLEKTKKNVKKNGKLFVAVPNAASLNRRIGYEAGLLSDIMELSETDYALGHKRYFIEESIRSVCTSAGLQIESVEGIYLKPFTTSQILSLKLDKDIIEAFCRVGRDYPELCVGMLLECTV